MNRRSFLGLLGLVGLAPVKAATTATAEPLRSSLARAAHRFGSATEPWSSFLKQHGMDEVYRIDFNSRGGLVYRYVVDQTNRVYFDDAVGGPALLPPVWIDWKSPLPSELKAEWDYLGQVDKVVD